MNRFLTVFLVSSLTFSSFAFSMESPHKTSSYGCCPSARTLLVGALVAGITLIPALARLGLLASTIHTNAALVNETPPPAQASTNVPCDDVEGCLSDEPAAPWWSPPQPSISQPTKLKLNEEPRKFDDVRVKSNYPELSKTYKPHTKDSKENRVPKEDQLVIAEVNFETAYFGQHYYTDIVRGREAPFAIADRTDANEMPSQAPKSGTGKEMLVRPYGKTRMTLFLPSGHKPYQPTDSRARIIHEQSGSYVLELDEPLREVQVPLEENSRESIGLRDLKLLTRTLGFDRNTLRDRYFYHTYWTRDARALSEALELERYVSQSFLYSVGARSETDPIDALNAGAFQCDMAAYIMIAFLRDVYGIPSRVVTGYRAKKPKSGAVQKSYLVNDEAHTWVEAYIGGEWFVFDPTPTRKDREDKDVDESEFSNRSLDKDARMRVAWELEYREQSREQERRKQEERERLKQKQEEYERKQHSNNEYWHSTRY